MYTKPFPFLKVVSDVKELSRKDIFKFGVVLCTDKAKLEVVVHTSKKYT